MDANLSTQALTDALQKGLYFTPDDLAANERGKLSQRQKTALLERLNSGRQELGQGCRFVMVVLALIVLILLVVGFFLVAGDTARALLNAAKGLTSDPIGLVFLLPVVILVLVVGNNMRLQSRWRGLIHRLRESPDSAVIQKRQGRVKRLTVTGGRRMVTKYIVINGKPLQILEMRQYDAFRDGVAYEVFYLELGPLLHWLSAKVVDAT